MSHVCFMLILLYSWRLGNISGGQLSTYLQHQPLPPNWKRVKQAWPNTSHMCVLLWFYYIHGVYQTFHEVNYQRIHHVPNVLPNGNNVQRTCPNTRVTCEAALVCDNVLSLIAFAPPVLVLKMGGVLSITWNLIMKGFALGKQGLALGMSTGPVGAKQTLKIIHSLLNCIWGAVVALKINVALKC